MRYSALAVLVASSAVACKPAAPARSVTDGDQSSVLAAIEPAMNKAGHSCVVKEKGLLCDAGVKGKLTFVLVVLDAPVRRIGIVVISKMKMPCQEALAGFNEVNRHVDIVNATCGKDGDFGAVGYMPIPAAGLTGEDVSHFSDIWLQSFLGAVKQYNLLEAIE